MKITLSNFGCWTDRTFEFPDSGNVLLMAPSGTGKTTIIRAIMFALFGKGTKLTTHGETSCKVTLEFEDLTIVRSKGPRKLIVNEVFEDAHGQSIIDARFPNGDSFYLDQLDKKCFLTMSNGDKLATLDKIAMRNVPIQSMVKNVKADAQDTQSIGLKKQGEADYIRRTLLELGTIPETDGNVVTAEDIEMERSALVELISKRTAYTEYVQSQDKIEILSKQMDDLLQSMPDSIQVQEYKDALETLTESKAYYKKHNLYRLYSNQLQDYKSNEKDEPDLSERITSTSEQLDRARANRPEDKAVSALEKYLPKLKFKEELENDLKNIGTVLDADGIKEMESDLQARIDSCNSMQCPSCHVALLKNGNELVVCETTPAADTSIQTLREQLNVERSRRSRHIELTESIAKYNPEHVYEHLLRKFQDMKTRVETCKSLEDTLRQLKERKWARDKVESASKELKNRVQQYIDYKDPLPQTEDEIDSKIKQSEAKIAQYHQVESERDRCYRQIKDMKNTIKRLDTPAPPFVSETDVEDKRALIDRLKEQVSIQERIRTIQEKRRHLECAERESLEAFDRLKQLNKLKDLIYEAQSEVLQATLHTINTNAIQYLEDFFPEEEMVSDLTMDTNKNNKITNNIFFKGHKVDFSTLSGGERDRLTLAYALAISDLSNDRLFIMDECVSSLDIDNACNVFNSIQSSKDSLTIVVAHQIVMGIFDSIVKL